MVRAYATDGGANGSYEYKKDDGTWAAFTPATGFGPVSGFPYTDNKTSYFRATYATAGDYTIHLEFRQVGTNAVISEKDVNITVAYQDTPMPAPQTTEIVRAADLNVSGGWVFYNDSTETISTTSVSSKYDFVADPAASNPTTKGALRFSNPTDKMDIASFRYAGTKLKDIAAIGYDSYNTSGAAGTTYIQFNVDFDGTDTWQKRLTYIPATSDGAWQSNEGVQGGDGMWQWSGGNLWPDGKTAVDRSWDDIVASFPNARIRLTDSNAPGGGVFVRSEPGTTNYVDNIYVATESEHITYDFDPTALSAPADPKWSAGCDATKLMNLTASWGEVTEADKYLLQTKNGGSWSSSDEVTGTSKVLSLAPDGAWQFRVASVKNNILSEWSESCSIVVDAHKPSATIAYSSTAPTNGSVTVTLTADEDIETPTGWDPIGSSKKEFTKVFTQTTNEKVPLIDLVGNEGESDTIFIDWIDTTGPTISSVNAYSNEDGSYTLFAVTSSDAESLTFLVNGVEIPGVLASTTDSEKAWVANTGVLTAGTYTLAARTTDALGNSTTQSGQSFTISAVLTDDELESVLTGASPLSTVKPTNTLPITGDAVASSTTATSSSDDDGDVLGTNTKADDTPLDQTAAIAQSKDGWKLWGIAWYWYLLILAIIAALWWLIKTYRNRNDGENADF